MKERFQKFLVLFLQEVALIHLNKANFEQAELMIITKTLIMMHLRMKKFYTFKQMDLRKSII